MIGPSADKAILRSYSFFSETGVTWTTVESENEVYDRIDMAYHTTSDAYEVRDVRLIGGPGDNAGIKVRDYESDHYAVVATYKILK